MSTRKIKDAKDTTTNELIYFKGHAKATFMSDGRNVEEAIHQIGAGGGAQGPQGPEGPKGDDGVGITSVVQTTTSSADGGSNVMTVTLSNGTKSTFTVKNGSKGSQGVQGPKGDTGANGTNGKDGADGATFTPSVDSAGNLSWTNNGGLSNPPTVNIKGPKGDSGEGGGSGDRKEVIFVDMGTTANISELRPNVVYWISGADYITIDSFETPLPEQNSYDIFTAILVIGSGTNDSFSLTLPDYVRWANGVIPEVIYDLPMELSISRLADGYGREIGVEEYLAVLTPFKAAE